jgi:O-succinylbenzoic acid--CoA ligase
MIAMDEVPDPLRAAAQAWPDAPALDSHERSYTFRELDGAAERAAMLLRAAGTVQGEPVALVSGSNVWSVILLCALIRAGAVVFPLNPKFPPAYLRAVLDRVRCRVCLLEGDTIPPELDGIVALRMDRFKGGMQQPLRSDSTVQADLPSLIVLTSGSSGMPKAALLRFGGIHENARRANQNMPLHARKRWLLSLPLYHVSGIGIVMRCLLGGACIAIPDPRWPLREALRRLGVTHVSMVATQLHRALQDPDTRIALGRRDAILLGGGPLPEALLQEAQAARLKIVTTYGLTEMGSQVTATSPKDPAAFLRSSGRPLAPDTVRIAPDGMIETGGATRFAGYIEGDTLIQPFTEDGWFRTGDLGHFDEHGCLHVTGRADNMYISGGENVHPEEVEAAIAACPGVRQAIVVPVAHAEYGQVGAAFVQSGTPAGWNPEQLREQLRERLPHFKIPLHFLEWPSDMPDTSLKPSRAFLRARAGDSLREAGPQQHADTRQPQA